MRLIALWRQSLFSQINVSLSVPIRQRIVKVDRVQTNATFPNHRRQSTPESGRIHRAWILESDGDALSDFAMRSTFEEKLITPFKSDTSWQRKIIASVITSAHQAGQKVTAPEKKRRSPWRGQSNLRRVIPSFSRFSH
jgi:hypothetical protein